MIVEGFKQPPKANAVAVFVPRPIGNIRRWGAAGGWGENRARHGFPRAPFLAIHDNTVRNSCAVGQVEGLAVSDGGIGNSLSRQHCYRSSRGPMENVKGSSPSMSTINWSSGLIRPTPAGVPVMMMSPGLRVY